MPAYITLVNFTDQGVRNVKDTTKRAKAFQTIGGKAGIKLKEIYWTMGRYDVVVMTEAPDDETISRAMPPPRLLGECPDRDPPGLLCQGDGQAPEGAPIRDLLVLLPSRQKLLPFFMRSGRMPVMAIGRQGARGVSIWRILRNRQEMGDLSWL